MRVLSGLVLLGVAFAAPATARAAETPMCDFRGTPDMALQERLGPFLGAVTGPGGTTGGGATAAAQTALGSQFTLIWLDHVRAGWGVAFSPGPLDATAARAAIRAQLASQFDPGTVAYLDGTLRLLETPHSSAELEAAQAQIIPLMGQTTGIASVGITCAYSDAVRVIVDVAAPDTPETRGRIEPLLAPFGDKVHVRYGQSFPVAGAAPEPERAAQQRPTLRVRDYVSLPRTSRCARTVHARPRAGADVRRVRLAIGKRVSAGKSPRLKLKSRRSTVTVTVTLGDGTSAIERLTYRRCG